MTKALYEKRRGALLTYYKTYHTLPSYEKVRELFGVKSKNSAYRYVEKFIEDGLVAKADDGRLIPTHKLYELRVLGSVQAGFPTPAEEELADTMSLDDFLVENPASTFLLRVSGDSMIDAGIMEGDMVLVDRSKKPNNNDIVIAQVGNEWTMKYLIKKSQNTLILRPANKAYKDIHPEEEVQIGGVVTSVIRKY
jgi:SOS regulatory protein LexA